MSNLFQNNIVNRQIVSVNQAVSDTSTTTTLASFVTATGSSVVVTPKYTTSSFLIIAQGTFISRIGFASIFRNSTNLGDSSFGLLGGNRPAVDFHAGSMSVYDSPGTTSPITYEVRVRSADGNSSGWGFVTHTLTVIEFDRNSGI